MSNKNEELVFEEVGFGNDASETLFDDLDGLEEDLPFEETEVEETQEEYQVDQFFYNIERLLPEFENYFQQNKGKVFGLLADKSIVDEIETQNAYFADKGTTSIKFKNDDEIIESIYNYLILDVIEKRIKVLKEFYRYHMTELYNQAPSDSKTLELPIISITQTSSNPKPQISKPGDFANDLEEQDLKNDFLTNIAKIDWAKMNKGGIEKAIQLMSNSKDPQLKEFFKQLEEKNIVTMTEKTFNYSIKNKVNS